MAGALQVARYATSAEIDFLAEKFDFASAEFDFADQKIEFLSQ